MAMSTMKLSLGRISEVNQLMARILYGALFVVVVPIGLALWMVGAEHVVALPSYGTPEISYVYDNTHDRESPSRIAFLERGFGKKSFSP